MAEALVGPLHYAPLREAPGPPVFYALHLIWSAGADLRQVPLIRRKSMMAGIWQKGTPHMLVAQHVKAEGKALYEEVCQEDGEGSVAKLAKSP